MLSIKEYAEKSGKSVQAVYKQIKSKENSIHLEGHIFEKKIKNRNVKFLDETAIKILDESSKQTPIIMVQTDNKEHIENLEKENKNLILKIAELQEIIILKSEKIEKLQEANILLLEEKKEEPQKKIWWKFGK